MCSIYTHRLIFSERERFKVIDLVSFLWSGSERNLVGYHKYIPSILKSYHKGNFLLLLWSVPLSIPSGRKTNANADRYRSSFYISAEKPLLNSWKLWNFADKNSVSTHLCMGAKSVKLSLIIGHESRKYWSN